MSKGAIIGITFLGLFVIGGIITIVIIESKPAVQVVQQPQQQTFATSISNTKSTGGLLTDVVAGLKLV